MTTGYLHPDYARSLTRLGSPRRLPHSGGWVLRRPIPGSQFVDAAGCYPLLTCEDWTLLGRDLDELGDEVVSVVAIADPFGAEDMRILRESFPDLVRPFKDHFIVDLRRDPRSSVSKHHLRNARRALRQVDVAVCEDPIRWLDDWELLYSNLVRRHVIRGAALFSRDSFIRQFSIPGLTLLRASRDGATVGLNMWYTQLNRANYHLGAYSAVGYQLQASFALFWTAIEHFGQVGLDWLGLGAGAGIVGGSGEDGLSRFKRGWATGTRTAYICGRICDRAKYRQLALSAGSAPFDYFPVYRWPDVSSETVAPVVTPEA
jgi:hypothetical protein